MRTWLAPIGLQIWSRALVASAVAAIAGAVGVAVASQDSNDTTPTARVIEQALQRSRRDETSILNSQRGWECRGLTLVRRRNSDYAMTDLSFCGLDGATTGEKGLLPLAAACETVIDWTGHGIGLVSSDLRRLRSPKCPAVGSGHKPDAARQVCRTLLVVVLTGDAVATLDRCRLNPSSSILVDPVLLESIRLSTGYQLVDAAGRVMEPEK